MRKVLAVLAGLAVLGAANWAIYGREKQLAEGAVVLLELAPVDPRSLMQGDYMALRFKVTEDAFRSLPGETQDDGRVVLAVDERGVARFTRFDDGTPLAPGEIVMRYRVRNNTPKFATNAFFFQEGHAEFYARARYGEFRVSASGEAILTGLRGETLDVLGPPR